MLPRVVPIVLVCPEVPSVGSGCWDAVAQFQEVFFLSAGDDKTEMLLRAHVEKAAMVLLLTDTRLDGADSTGAEGQQAIMWRRRPWCCC